MKESSINATRRKLETTWSDEAARDLFYMHGIDDMKIEWTFEELWKHFVNKCKREKR